MANLPFLGYPKVMESGWEQLQGLLFLKGITLFSPWSLPWWWCTQRKYVKESIVRIIYFWNGESCHGCMRWTWKVAWKRDEVVAAASSCRVQSGPVPHFGLLFNTYFLGWPHPPFLKFLELKNDGHLIVDTHFWAFNLLFGIAWKKKTCLPALPSSYKLHEIDQKQFSGSWVNYTSITCLKINTYVLKKSCIFSSTDT